MVVKDTYSRDSQGRFIVTLPLNQNLGVIGESKAMAISCLKAIEQKFLRDPMLEQEYKKFMLEHEQLEHMRDTKSNLGHKICYYLPHYCSSQRG